MLILAGKDVADDPDRVVEKVDVERAWARMPHGPYRTMLWELCAEDRTLLNASMKAGMYPAKAKATAAEAAVLLALRLNRKEVGNE